MTNNQEYLISPIKLKAVLAYLKFMKIKRGIVKVRSTSIELQVPARQEGVAAYILFCLFSEVPGIKMKVTRLPWYKIWIWNVVLG